MPLKLVLVGPRGTVFQNKKADGKLLADLVEFIRTMSAKGVRVALWSRQPTTFSGPGYPAEPVETYLSKQSGVSVPFFRASYGALAARQASGSVDPILKDLGVSTRETILVGNEDSDMQAGVNNKLLLVRPEWYPNNLDYGFSVPSLAKLARFCEIFGLRQHPIYWSISDQSLDVRAMGPFSTKIPDFAGFGSNAKNAAKFGVGETRFWFLMIISSLYFSGLMHEIDYICSYPGHNPTVPGAANKGLAEVLSVLGKCFRKAYLPDLIVRHVPTVKSQNMSASVRTFANQLNTIHLNQRPRSYDGPARKTAISLRGKRVLVVDDICTSGRSLDVARAYIEAADGSATLFSWLKTINTGFMHMTAAPTLRPYVSNTILADPPSRAYGYHDHIVDPHAPDEIDRLLTVYKATA